MITSHALQPPSDGLTTEVKQGIPCRHHTHINRLPDIIVSDQDSKFASKFWSEVHCILGTKLLMSTVFHPQTDGASERANRSVGQILQTVIRPDQSDWVDQLLM